MSDLPSVGVPRDVGCRALVVYAANLFSVQFPDGIPSGAAAAQTPVTSTARDVNYLLDADYVFGQNITEHNPACAIALRSPASQRSSGLRTDIHQIFTLT
eukprot:scaffold67129_cov30-Phaeocystis_antarctica.AAC.1